MDSDVIIVGTGQAGVPLATALAAQGKKVVVIERSAPGGTCVNYGCTPTKTLVASARAAHVMRTSARLGVSAPSVVVDFPEVMRRKDRVVQRWREGVLRRLRDHSDRVQLVEGQARFVGERTVEAAGQRFRAPVVILNVGCRAAIPDLPGLDEVRWLDNARILNLRELPEHLLVLGGGYVGCEFAQMFRRFGSEVTMIDRGEHLLSREDPEISAALEEAFFSEGIKLELSAEVDRISVQGGKACVRLEDGREPLGSYLLVATGRRPNTDDLGCAAAGISLDPRGYVVADEQYRTSAPGVFAVGDVLGGPQFTHVSWDDHRLLLEVLEGRTPRPRTERVVPYCVFTDPQVAGVGLSEAEAKRRGLDYELGTIPFSSIARAKEVDEPTGVLRVLVDPKTERILGAQIVGAEAGELIHLFSLLMQADAPARVLVEAEMIHPTFAEGVQAVLMARRKSGR